MKIIETVAEMRSERARMTSPVALVPTLGGLHAGHEALLHAARRRAGTVIASLFLNPTQFGENEDLDRYPADRERDLAVMRKAGVDAVFAPSNSEMYPPDDDFVVDPGAIGEILEGAHRPGHLRGVSTVVAKLFIATRPDLAYFGEKDAQQIEVVRRMARGLLFGIEIVPIPTVRDENGLALSSRHAYLSDDERVAAKVVYRSLCRARDAWEAGERDKTTLEDVIRAVIDTEPLATLDYAAVVDARTFGPISEPGQGASGPDLTALALVAARFGSTRLIDNIRLDRNVTF
ncbi:MAG: pantoate--beta-alanine ligase [Chloroflexi bacterium]|nr:pantoate--beta-alanine ligase [Chloroflexota bacterium]